MKIYFVETNAGNEICAVERGKCKTYDLINRKLDGKIDIDERNAEGTLQHKKIVAELKKYFASLAATGELAPFDYLDKKPCKWADIIDNTDILCSDRTQYTQVY